MGGTVLKLFKQACDHKNVLYCRYLTRNPEANEEDAYKHIMKYVVPKTVVGSPRYFAQTYQDLLAIVDACGPPHLMVTLCENEEECPAIRAMEEILQQIHANLTWQHAAVECSRVFLHKLDTFMKNYVLNKKINILGRRVTVLKGAKA